MSVRIRLAEPGSWERVRDLRLRALADAPDAFGALHEDEVGSGESAWRSWVTGWEGARNAMAVAEDGEDWVGMAVGSRQGEEPDAHLYSMWVDPAWRRLGVGARLVEEVVSWARSWSARSVILGVTQGNDAERFYERLGFVPTGEQGPLREGSELQVLVLRRDLV